MSLVNICLEDALWEGVEVGTEALVEEWLVQPGAHISQGQALVTVVLIKSSHEVTSPVAGILESICVPVEATFARGATLAEIRQE